MNTFLARYTLATFIILITWTSGAVGFQHSVKDIYEQSISAVVSIQSASLGTGYLIHPDGCLITAAHVVGTESQEEITVTFQDGEAHSARILSFDNKNDVAILKIDGQDFHWLKLGDSELVAITDEVITIGYPKPETLGQDDATVSVGRVEAFKTEPIRYEPMFGRSVILENVIQISGTIRPGSSGGPVLNFLGEVIGTVASAPQSSELSNTAFIVPINDAPIPSTCLVQSDSPQSTLPLTITIAAILILGIGSAAWWQLSRQKSGNPVTMLGNCDFFSGLDSSELVQLRDACELKTFNSGDALVQEGDMDSHTMFVILKGQAEVSSRGKVLGMRGVGRTIGELSLFTGEPRTADVTALKPTKCLELSREALIRLLKLNPEIAVKMFDDMLFRLQEVHRVPDRES